MAASNYYGPSAAAISTYSGPCHDEPDVNRLRSPSQRATEWEQWRSIATEVDQLRRSGQAIAAIAESLHLHQVHVAELGWTNDLGDKLNDAEKLAKRALSLIDSLRRFTKRTS